MSLITRIDKGVLLSPSFADARGNAVPVTDLGSVPSYTSSDDTVATVLVSADGSTATVVPTGKTGTVQVNMTVDADPDPAIDDEIVGALDIVFKSGLATVVTLNGTVIDLPTAPAPAPAPVEPPVEAPAPAPVDTAPVETPAAPPVDDGSGAPTTDAGAPADGGNTVTDTGETPVDPAAPAA